PYSDAATADLTSLVTWASATSAVATIGASGLAHGASPGTSSISATFGAIRGSTLLTITAAPVSPEISGTPTSPVLVGTAYNFAFTVTGTPIPTVTVDSGELPPGLTLSNAGVLSGTPTTGGIYAFALRAQNGVVPDAITPVLTVLVNEAVGTVTEVVGSVSIIHSDLTVSTAVVG